MSTIKEKKVFHKFRPTLDVWICEGNGESYIYKDFSETWYGGDGFCSGVTGFIQIKKGYCLAIRFTWWVNKIGYMTLIQRLKWWIKWQI